MITLEFPSNNGHPYYKFYTCWIKNVFEVAGAQVKINPELKYLAPAAYFIKVNGKNVFIEFSDFPDEHRYKIDYRNSTWRKLDRFYEPEKMDCPIFKRAHRPDYPYLDNVFPMGPFYVADNSKPDSLVKLLSMGNIYDPFKAHKILHTNRVYAGAVLTRKPAYAQIDRDKLLPEVTFDTSRVDLFKHYERHKHLLGSLNISGAHFTSIDLGPIESMFMGVCTLINDVDLNLPFGKTLTKGEHYLALNKDYSNINEQLNYFYENRAECKDIGDAAYELMQESCHPDAIVQWIAQVTEEYYG